MERLAILLGLDGSAESMLAAHQSWDLAKSVGGKVSAVHVVDTARLWNLLGSTTAGFIGSGPYVNVYESTSQMYRSLAETLTDKYRAMAEGALVDGDVSIEEGDPAQQLSALANSHHIVVVGHRKIADQSPAERKFKPAFGVAENLVQTLTRPLLICSTNHVPWKTLRIVVYPKRLNLNCLASCVRFADLLQLNVSVLCLADERDDTDNIDTLEKFFANNEFCGEVSIEVIDAHPFFESAVLNDTDWHADAALGPYLDHLIVIPTIATAAGVTVLDRLSAASFVNRMSVPAMIMWPENYSLPPLQHMRMMEQHAK